MQPTQGHVFVNQYLLIKDLGRGAHGAVKLVYNTEDDRVYAMKVQSGWMVAFGFARCFLFFRQTSAAASAEALCPLSTQALYIL